MKNVLGNAITLTLFGESHGEKIGCVIDGLSAGIKVDNDFINDCLSKRRPQGKGETARVEKDNYAIVSGVFNGYTTGTPLTILIDNANTNSKDYDVNKNLLRPSHIDYVAHEKYHGYEDYRGGGHFSGRITAPIVAAGAIILKALEKFNINIATHIKQCGNVCDVDFTNLDKEINKVNSMSFPIINDDVYDDMQNEIKMAMENNDSVGGIIQVAVNNLPVGIGEPIFSSLEGELSKALFGIGGIKGIEFGLGFKFANANASKVNDAFVMQNGDIVTKTNNNGGINGGISNGMPIIFNLAVRPTPSISQVQDTVDINTKTNSQIKIVGRHDPAIIRRINIVVRCMCALVIADMLTLKHGNDVFLKDKLS